MDDSKPQRILLTYKNIKHALIVSLVPSWVVVRDSLDTEHFEETFNSFIELMESTSKWLKIAKKYTKTNGALVDINTVEKVIKSPNAVKLKISKKEMEDAK